MTAIRGHRLYREGRPVIADDCDDCGTPDVVLVDWYINTVGVMTKVRTAPYTNRGHAYCGCGWTGPHRTSTRQRQQDHRDHKAGLNA